MFSRGSGTNQELAPLKESSEEALPSSTTAVGESEAKGEEGAPGPKMAWVMDRTLREKEAAKWERLVAGASTKAPPAAAKCLQACAPYAGRVVVCCEVCLPAYARVLGVVWNFMNRLPTDWFNVVWGLCLVFFGGFYPLTMAAFEAARQCGGQDTYAAIHDLQVQFINARDADRADNLKDDDGDGVADVEQMSAKDLVKRKSHLILTATDPAVLDRGFQGVLTAWLAVIAALKIQFAQMIALGAAIGGFLVMLLKVPVTQILVHILEEDVHKWIPQCISYVCKAIALIVAWYIQKIISTIYSAMRGGLMVSRSALLILAKRNVVTVNPDESYVDEIAGWILAALGIAFQFALGLSPPLIVVIILWPFWISETVLLWAISSETVAETAG